jgi:murein DD-endopeptidase MepM/ murein hydrolase activator NlpD
VGKGDRGGFVFQVIPRSGKGSWSFQLGSLQVRLLVILGVTLSAVGLFMVVTWWFLAREAAEKWRLEAVVDSLLAEQERVAVLVERMERVEREYEGLRSLFGVRADQVAPDLWLPPTGLPAGEGDGEDASGGLPTSWPLTRPGFVTRPLLEGETGDHPGLDIAIPTHSYVRAAGGGRVVRTGEDPTYGLFIVLEHPEGYETVYAHASMILAERGATVRRNEVIALTGSTGKSTAPHLHFEILLEGVPLDPLSMVEPPA